MAPPCHGISWITDIVLAGYSGDPLQWFGSQGNERQNSGTTRYMNKVLLVQDHDLREMILQMMLLNDCYHQAPGVQDNLQECNIEWRWVRRTGSGGFFCLFSQSQSFFLYESRRLASWTNPSNFSGLGEKKRREAKGGGGSKAGRSFIKSFS